jgi:type IV secretion system protein TrbJ
MRYAPRGLTTHLCLPVQSMSPKLDPDHSTEVCPSMNTTHEDAMSMSTCPDRQMARSLLSDASQYPRRRHELARPSDRARHGLGRWAAVATTLVGVLVARPAQAQWTVYDPANYIENALQYAHQLIQIKYQLQQIQYQLQALSKLAGAPWRDVNAPLADIASVMGGPQSLGYAAPNVTTTFQTLFPPSRPVQNWPTEQVTRAQASVDVLQAALAATAQQQSAIAPGEQTIERMKQLNGEVQGHEQALELQNSAAVYSAEELMLLREAAMAQTNIQAVYYANQMNEESQRDVTARATLNELATLPAPGADVSLRVSP